MKRGNALLFVLSLLIGTTLLISARMSYDFPKTAYVYLDRQNVFYAGVENPISVTIPGVPVNTIFVISPNCDIHATPKPGSFIIKPKSGNSTDLAVKYVENGDTLSAGVFKYRIKRIPDPVAYVVNIRNEGVMLKSNLPLINGVFTRMENFDFDCAFKPQSFTMGLFHDSTWTEYKATGPACTPEMLAALHTAMPEDRIIFHDVKTLGPDSTLRLVNPVLITVK